MLSCRLMGHKFDFWAEAETLRWECARDCGAGGEKRYPSAAEAQRYARAFNRRDSDEIGRRPTLSLLPLWLSRRAGGKSSRESRSG
jgi:hypothetical protein